MGCDAGFPVRALPTGMWISQRPPGDALAAVPVVAPLALFSERSPESSVMMMLGKVAAALAVAGASVLFFHVCRQVAPGGCWPATVLFAFGTCLWSVASQALWMHGPATLWLCCALYGATHPTVKNWPLALVTGVSLGLAVVTRPTTCLFALATVGALVFPRNWRALLYVCLGGAIPAIFLLGLNWSLFGDPLLGGYGGEWTHSQAPPFWLGLAGLLLAPSRGVLIYSPALLLVPFGALLLTRRSDGLQAGPRVMLVTWLSASLGTLLLYAPVHACWDGCFY